MQAVGEDETMERTCVVTRRHNEPEAMIRFVRAPDGALTPDIRSRLPGRGVWVTARADLVAEAARKQMFARVLKAQVAISAGSGAGRRPSSRKRLPSDARHGQ